MIKKQILILLGVNSLCVSGLLYFYLQPEAFMTRVNYYNLKKYDYSISAFKSDSHEDLLSDYERLRNSLDYKVDCKMAALQSFEVGTLFFDIACTKKGIAKKLFKDLFWLNLSEKLSNVGRKKSSQSELKDFYYLSYLTEVSFDNVQKIILPRSSFIFEDHSSRIPLPDFIAYVSLSLFTLNFFLVRYFATRV